MKGLIIVQRVVINSFLLLLIAHFEVTAAPTAPDDSNRLLSALSTMVVDSPAVQITEHNVGNIVLGVANNGTFGDYVRWLYNKGSYDAFTGLAIHSCEFPKGSGVNYLYGGAFWIGAIVGRDTLVSTGVNGWGRGGFEMFPDSAPEGNITYRSTKDPAKSWYQGAVSEQDYVAAYFDTCKGECPGMSPDAMDGRSHRPLNVEVTQRSYAWSYPYAEDFVLFDYTIRNISLNRLKQVYLGIYVDADVLGMDDDVCGFRRTLPASYSRGGNCKYDDSVNIAWIADNDGDSDLLCPSVTGVRIVRAPAANLEMSFNWWVSNENPDLDFGPQRLRKFRDLGLKGAQGTPMGDRNKYWYLSNGEFDYDQVYSAVIGPDDSGYTHPELAFGDSIAIGYDTRYLLSFGPFNLEPGQTLPLSFAYVGGLNFHKQAGDGAYLPDSPDEYYKHVSFADLGYNATWADWVYDNPGWDSDGDGYAGEYHVCRPGDSLITSIDTVYNADSTIIEGVDTIWTEVVDTIWYKGDGVPDWRAASPPPRPDIRLIMGVGKIVIQFNGWRSETEKDFFTHKVDFEGYRIYMARDDRWDSYAVLDSYDKDDYSKYQFDTSVGSDGEFVLKDDPFTMQQLRCAYAPNGCTDSNWNPLVYTRSHLYQKQGFPDSVFYFVAQDYNRSLPGVNTGLNKLYSDAIKPKSLNKDSCRATDTTSEGYFKYYEYEYTIDNLLPTVRYYINVCTFDFGSPSMGMPPMESPRTENPIITYAEPSSDSAVAYNLKVGVYPNPYRIDAHYADQGFEGTGPGERDRPSDRNRRIHFFNLPAQCTIKIFTLDGDLVRQIDHNYSASDPLSNHDTWNLIGRNTQLAVSGLYYWTVESPGRKVQIGKLVLIM
jgi:hypothetical protein